MGGQDVCLYVLILLKNMSVQEDLHGIEEY